MSMRIGLGFDSHAFKPGVPLVIGGLKIDHPEGLAGHSDGDLLLHAITDALLGAVSAGDIGTFFPPSDPKWKNADSTIFLQTALEEIALAGYKIVNIDCVLVMHRPKIVPIASELRERVADLLSLDLKNVSIKGKTPEGLSQDGTAVAHVVVLLESIELPGEHGKLTMEADVPTDADIDGVFTTLVSEVHDIIALARARKRPPFDPGDLT
ncbi:MAG TPA: 2-C-methyl-D-erythritol 2,4-cyclodiphosphate synthase [Acidobacteriaceae bacterium]